MKTNFVDANERENLTPLGHESFSFEAGEFHSVAHPNIGLTGPFRLRRNLVDVTGIEPVTPCLQNNQGNIMWLILLAFTYVT